MTDGGHLSIGEVLGVLQDDHPEVTISKIRFLESQGLISPERTASGYRMFRDADVAQLRWVLHQQKDLHLPLRVIKDRLDDADPVDVEAALAAGLDAAPPDGTGGPERGSRADNGVDTSAGPMPAAGGAAVRAAPGRRVPSIFQRQDSRRSPLPGPGTANEGQTPAGAALSSLEAEELSASEVCERLGVASSLLDELERHGLVSPRTVGDERFFDSRACEVVRLGAAMRTHGLEPRHLKRYRTAANAEAGVLEQVVMPLLKARSQSSQAEAAERLDELRRLGRELADHLLAGELADLLGQSAPGSGTKLR